MVGSCKHISHIVNFHFLGEGVLPRGRWVVGKGVTRSNFWYQQELGPISKI